VGEGRSLSTFWGSISKNQEEKQKNYKAKYSENLHLEGKKNIFFGWSKKKFKGKT
jgi:hypothetical protein